MVRFNFNKPIWGKSRSIRVIMYSMLIDIELLWEFPSLISCAYM